MSVRKKFSKTFSHRPISVVEKIKNMIPKPVLTPIFQNQILLIVRSTCKVVDQC